MSQQTLTQPLTAAGFAPFGDVLDFWRADKLINQGLCGRYRDRATLAHHDGRAGISLFDAVARHLPYQLEMMERPLGITGISADDRSCVSGHCCA